MQLRLHPTDSLTTASPVGSQALSGLCSAAAQQGASSQVQAGHVGHACTAIKVMQERVHATDLLVAVSLLGSMALNCAVRLPSKEESSRKQAGHRGNTRTALKATQPRVHPTDSLLQ